MSLKNKIMNAVNTVTYPFKRKIKIPIPQLVPSDNMLAGKVALITGGSSGIGFSIAEAFNKAGAKVIIAGRNEQKLADKCKGFEDRRRYIVMDVLNIERLPGAIEKARGLFSENRIDILVNSAGVVNHSGFEAISEAEYDLIMDINVKGIFFMSQAMARYMKDYKIHGHILNISSAAALRPAWTPYQMSKWAVRGFTVGLADSLLKYGITVNAIAPGPTATAMMGMDTVDSIDLDSNPLGRYAMPEEIASLAVVLASDIGSLVVGDTLYATGGGGILK